MGVNGILPRVLSTAGRKIDLTQFRNGVLEDQPKQFPTDQPSPPPKRQRLSSVVSNNKRRPMRIGLDVSAWIAKASHGYGSMLVDERHLSNYGRAALFQEQQQQEQENGNNTNNNNWHVEGTAKPIDRPSPEKKKPMTTMEERQFITQCATFVLKRVLQLRDSTQSEILVILDGATPPIKANTTKARRQLREEAAQERDAAAAAADAIEKNDEEQEENRLRAARKAGGAGVNPAIHSAIVANVMMALREHKITFLVSPYEADGQLAYLSQCGYIDLILTDDSDLIGHGGATCILYKYDDNRQEGMLLQRHDLGATARSPCCLVDFSNAMLSVMFVAAGCDYCDNIKGIGIVTARNIVKMAFHGRESYDHHPHTKKGTNKHNDSPEQDKIPSLAKVFQQIYQSAYDKNNLTEQAKMEYETNFLAALLMYRHPIVYDPMQGKCVFSGDPPHGSDPELMDYEPYAQLCSDLERRQEIVGKLRESAGMQTLITEGWINPRINRPYPDMHMPAEVMELWEQEQDAMSPRRPKKASTETTDHPTTTAVEEENDSPQPDETTEPMDVDDKADTSDDDALQCAADTVNKVLSPSPSAKAEVAAALAAWRNVKVAPPDQQQEEADEEERSDVAQDATQDDAAVVERIDFEQEKTDIEQDDEQHADAAIPETNIEEEETTPQDDESYVFVEKDEVPLQEEDAATAEQKTDAVDQDASQDDSDETVDMTGDDLQQASQDDDRSVEEEEQVEPQHMYASMAAGAEAEVIEIDDDGDDLYMVSTQEVPQHVGSQSSLSQLPTIDLTQAHSSGTSSASKFASQPSSGPSDGSHISADVRSPNLLPMGGSLSPY